MALALVPEEKVTCFFVDHILENAPTDEYPKLEEFLDYMTNTWIDDGLYDIDLWNHRNEAYNARLQIRMAVNLIQTYGYLSIQFKKSF